MTSRHRLLAVVALAWTCGHHARAELISLNVDPAGTTSNLNIYGTVLSSGSATWPSRVAYRDYQFELQTSSGTTAFDSFSVQLSASRKNATPPENTLRASLWAGPIVANPLLTDSLLTATIANSSITTSGYTSVLLTGSTFTPQPISITPSIFFFRIWAEGDGNSNGFQTKMANSLGEFQAVTMAPAPAIDGSIAFDTDGDGFIDNGEQSAYDPISEVPEPSTMALAAIGLAAAACVAARRAS